MDLNNYTPIIFHTMPKRSAYFAGRHSYVLENSVAQRYIDQGIAEDLTYLLPGGKMPALKAAPKGKAKEFFQDCEERYSNLKREVLSTQKELKAVRGKVSKLFSRVSRNNNSVAANREYSRQSERLQEVENDFIEKAQQMYLAQMQMEAARVDLIEQLGNDLKGSKEFKKLDKALEDLLNVNSQAKDLFNDAKQFFGNVSVMASPYVNGPMPAMIRDRKDQIQDVLTAYQDKAVNAAKGKVLGTIKQMIDEEIEARELFVDEREEYYD